MIYKTLLAVVLTIATIVLPTYFFWYKPKFKISSPGAYNKKPEKNSEVLVKLKAKVDELNKFLEDKKYNTKTCFLIDMNIESGRNRFFVFDIEKDSIVLSGLVAHGSCDEGFRTEAVFSNKVNSGCSSVGRYKIGNAYNGRFGTAYKLYGLDSTNNNAFQRSVVLHSYECVPEQETYPVPICNSRGCPMVSPGFMNQLKSIINSSGKPILLWIFN
jgi:hypothetical protein